MSASKRRGKHRTALRALAGGALFAAAFAEPASFYADESAGVSTRTIVDLINAWARARVECRSGDPDLQATTDACGKVHAVHVALDDLGWCYGHESDPGGPFFHRWHRCDDDSLRPTVDGLIKEGFVHVLDVDLESYFDTIPHDELMHRLEERISDGRKPNVGHRAAVIASLNEPVQASLGPRLPESPSPCSTLGATNRIIEVFSRGQIPIPWQVEAFAAALCGCRYRRSFDVVGIFGRANR